MLYKLCAVVLFTVCFASSDAAADEPKAGATPIPRERADPGIIEGVWQPTMAELGGKKLPDEVRSSITLEVKEREYTVTSGTTVDRGTFKLDLSTTPKSLDIIGGEGPNKGKTFLAIFEREGDTLRVCYDLSGKTRPTEFKTTEGSLLFLVEYKRKRS